MATGMDSGAIFAIDGDKPLNIAYSSGISSELVKKVRSLKPDSIERRFIMKGKPLHMSLTRRQNFYLKKDCVREGIRTLHMIPISFHRKGTTGYLCVASHKTDAIPYHDRNLLKIIAIHISNKIMNFNVKKEADRQAKALSSLKRISNVINKSEDIYDVFRNALNEITKLKFYKPNCGANIFLLQKDSDNLVLADYRGAGKKHGCRGEPLKIEECSCCIAARHGRITISKGCQKGERHDRKEQNKFPCKDICIPLMSRKEVLGVMNIAMPADLELEKTDHRILISICKQISVAIHNAHLYQNIENYRENIRDMGVKLETVKETERKRLARELHDQVGSNLTALNINLSALKTKQRLARSKNIDSCLDESIDMVKQTARLIRQIVGDLRSTPYNTPGLLDMIKQYTAKYSSWANIPVEIICNDNLPYIPPSEGFELFHIVQEALSNIAKHSSATRAVIEIKNDNGKTRVSVKDNGVGFDPVMLADKAKQGHYGLFGIAERAKNMSGLCEITSKPGKGTNITVEVR
jgi:signal transduction histidine kinase